MGIPIKNSFRIYETSDCERKKYFENLVRAKSPKKIALLYLRFPWRTKNTPFGVCSLSVYKCQGRGICRNRKVFWYHAGIHLSIFFSIRFSFLQQFCLYPRKWYCLDRMRLTSRIAPAAAVECIGHKQNTSTWWGVCRVVRANRCLAQWGKYCRHTNSDTSSYRILDSVRHRISSLNPIHLLQFRKLTYCPIWCPPIFHPAWMCLHISHKTIHTIECSCMHFHTNGLMGNILTRKEWTHRDMWQSNKCLSVFLWLGTNIINRHRLSKRKIRAHIRNGRTICFRVDQTSFMHCRMTNMIQGKNRLSLLRNLMIRMLRRIKKHWKHDLILRGKCRHHTEAKIYANEGKYGTDHKKKDTI